MTLILICAKCKTEITTAFNVDEQWRCEEHTPFWLKNEISKAETRNRVHQMQEQKESRLKQSIRSSRSMELASNDEDSIIP